MVLFVISLGALASTLFLLGADCTGPGPTPIPPGPIVLAMCADGAQGCQRNIDGNAGSFCASQAEVPSVEPPEGFDGCCISFLCLTDSDCGDGSSCDLLRGVCFPGKR